MNTLIEMKLRMRGHRDFLNTYAELYHFGGPNPYAVSIWDEHFETKEKTISIIKSAKRCRILSKILLKMADELESEGQP